MMRAMCRAICRVRCRGIEATRHRLRHWNQLVTPRLSGLSGFYRRRETRRKSIRRIGQGGMLNGGQMLMQVVDRVGLA